jgi:AcrR family transcriptional regulator
MAVREDPASVPRPVGRPRVIPNELSGDVREEILSIAAGLFESHGYTSTSTRTIADAVGLRQASLFHYFARKEDILTELLDRTVRLTLQGVRRVSLDDWEADLALWTLVDLDVSNLCQGPHNLGALQLLPEVRGAQFEWFWRRRRQLFSVYTGQIERGRASGLFPLAEQNATSDLVFGMVESVITARPQFRRRGTTPGLIADAALRVCGVPERRIRAIARVAVRPGE